MHSSAIRTASPARKRGHRKTVDPGPHRRGGGGPLLPLLRPRRRPYYGHTIPLTTDLHVYTRREPLGVTGHILAWNYPMQLFSRAVAPAIATGNCAVVKPADETPRTAIVFAELAVEAGMPQGVLNVVTGIGEEAGAALSAHPGVDHIGFVGSTTVGSVVAHAAAERVAPATLELGGKSPQIVFPDAGPVAGNRVHRESHPAERRPNLFGGFATAGARIRSRRARGSGGLSASPG